MRMKGKRAFSLLLCICMISILLPVTALAEDEVTIDDECEYTLSDSNKVITIRTEEPVTIKGNGNEVQNVQIDCDVAGVDLTLENVKINNGAANGCPLSFTGTGNTLTISGDNFLISYGLQPAVKVEKKVENVTELTINGDGELEAISRGKGAGIGGSGYRGSGGTVTIVGGTINATGGSRAAGIGGGYDGEGGDITISGGDITATGGPQSAGIGGGSGESNNSGNGGTVYISGGSVCAVSNGDGEKIGRSREGTNSGTLKNRENGDNVYLTTVTLSGVTIQSAISLLTASLNGTPYSYGSYDMYTDDNGSLYLYLPENTTTSIAETAADRYTGEVTTTTNEDTSTGELTVLKVTDVSPAGNNVPGSGELSVTFSKDMDTSSGTVSISPDGVTYTPLAAGIWYPGNTVYTVPYNSLQSAAQYTVKIEGFLDSYGNPMRDNFTHTFTTVSQASGGGGNYYSEPSYNAIITGGEKLNVNVDKSSGNA